MFLFWEDIIMARKSTRCANCGAKMRLVTVTKIDTYRTPEACQYDMSVTGRVPGEAAKTSYRELLCTCCGYRAPAGETKKAKRAYKKKNRKNGKKRFGLALILLLIAAVIVAAVVLLFGETIGAFFADLLSKFVK